jgi:hypothetical protein
MRFVGKPKSPRKYIRALARRVRVRIQGYKRPSKIENWRDTQLLAPPLQVSLRHGAGRNLVLGVALGYDLPTLLPFIRSLRRFSNCRALLIVDDEALAEAIEDEGVDCVSLPRSDGYQPNLNFARTAILLRALLGLSGQTDWVFLLDTRDVVFQAEPFQEIPTADIAFFEECEGYTFASSSINRNWLLGTFGQKLLSALDESEVLCAGTVLAMYDTAVSYCKLKLVTGSLVSERRHRSSGVDQITTNVIARLGLMTNSVIIPHDRQVATLSSANRDFLMPLGDDLFVDRAGNLPAIVHQYDRAPTIQEAVLRRYGQSFGQILAE